MERSNIEVTRKMKLLVLMMIVLGLTIGGVDAATGPPAPKPPTTIKGVQSYTPKVLWYRPSTKYSGRPTKAKKH
jgi:hypothetical protein